MSFLFLTIAIANRFARRNFSLCNWVCEARTRLYCDFCKSRVRPYGVNINGQCQLIAFKNQPNATQRQIKEMARSLPFNSDQPLSNPCRGQRSQVFYFFSNCDRERIK